MPTTKIKNVAVIGAGTMGHSLAQAFAQGGCNVWLSDVREEILNKAKSLISSNLKTLAELDMLNRKEPAAVLGRIQTTTRIETAAEKAEFVIEAIIEDPAAKKEMFAALDRICPPQAILASNTSYLDIFKFVETGRPDKVLITHWFAPPHLVPLVEVVKGPRTSPETVSRGEGFPHRNRKETDPDHQVSPGLYLQSSSGRPADRGPFPPGQRLRHARRHR